MNKSELKELVRQVMSEEEANEPEVIQSLRRIVDNKQYEKVKDPVSKKKMVVDLFTASAVVKVYDSVNDTNKAKLVTLPLPKLVQLVWKLIK